MYLHKKISMWFFCFHKSADDEEEDERPLDEIANAASENEGTPKNVNNVSLIIDTILDQVP